MRVKSRWLRRSHARSPEEIGEAAGANAFRLARTMLASMRKARFSIEPGGCYFALLGEALAFAIQCACRIAWPRLAEDERQRFATALAQACGRHLAESESELLGARTAADIRAEFIEAVNRRFDEYAELGYGPAGPDFAFLRYFASLVERIVPPDDARWVHDQVIGVEGPVAAATMAHLVTGLLVRR